jgi:hypothetical protein
MNALFLKDLAKKTHRGLPGRVEKGHSAGPVGYGYRSVRRLSAEGELVRGECRIEPSEVPVVERIFREFAAGKSPRAIARDLNAESVPGPSGRAWSDTTLRGKRSRGIGILNNELYVGVRAWNHKHCLKDPRTGRTVDRTNPESEWVRVEVPHLRIVSDNLWKAVKQRQGALAVEYKPMIDGVHAAQATFRGISTIPGITTSDGQGQDLFFPKPFNREQVEVVQRLAHRAGVVVQGPPGTGKTHTISNIICHYLALGKRVLVTSQKVPALRVLRGQLPAAIQPLAVSLLDSDRDGLKQFQESVDVIAEKLQRLKRHELLLEIESLEAEIDGLHRKLALIDHEVDDIGRAAITPVVLGSDRYEPVEAARKVMAEPDRTWWLDDPVDVGEEYTPRFSDSDISALRLARKMLGADLAYLGVRIPLSDELPTDTEVFSAHHDLSHAQELRQTVENGKTPAIADPSNDGIERAKCFQSDLRKLQDLRVKVASPSFGWTAVITEKLRTDALDPSFDMLRQMREEIDSLSSECSALLVQPVDLPNDWVNNQPLLDAIDRLSDGENATGFLTGLFNSKLKTSLASVKLVGSAPREQEDWRAVQRYIEASKRSQRLQLSWNFASSHSGLDPLSSTHLRAAHEAGAQLDHLVDLELLAELEVALDHKVPSFIPAWSTSIVHDEAATQSLLQALETHVAIHRLVRAEDSQRVVEAGDFALLHRGRSRARHWLPDDWSQICPG